VVAGPDDSDSVIHQMSESVVEIIDLVHHHVATVAASPLDHAAASCALNHGRNYFDELIANDHERITKTKFGDVKVTYTNGELKGLTELLRYRFEVLCNECDLAKSDHGIILVVTTA